MEKCPNVLGCFRGVFDDLVVSSLRLKDPRSFDVLAMTYCLGFFRNLTLVGRLQKPPAVAKRGGD